MKTYRRIRALRRADGGLSVIATRREMDGSYYDLDEIDAGTCESAADLVPILDDALSRCG